MAPHRLPGSAGSPCRASPSWPVPPLLPGWAEQDEPGVPGVDAQGNGPAPRRADNHRRLVLVELGLGDPDGIGEIFVRQLGIDDLVAVLGQLRRLHAAWDRLPAVQEEDSHGVVVACSGLPGCASLLARGFSRSPLHGPKRSRRAPGRRLDGWLRLALARSPPRKRLFLE